ncbi:MAG: hypothetical protein AB7E55_05905 [Pigmentiphaga sp.]
MISTDPAAKRSSRAMHDGESEAAMAELLAVLKRVDGKAFG